MRTHSKTRDVVRVRKQQPSRHLKVQLSDTHRAPLAQAASNRSTVNMQHNPPGTLHVRLHSKRRASRHNFAETLPTEMSVRIFGELDSDSLCSASRTCRLWHHIIEDSEQLWRRQCLSVRAVCQREVDSDRRDGLSWKVTFVRNYSRSCLKRDWLRGRYSHVSSADELSGSRMTPLDAETWGEILQAELDR